MEFTWKIFKVFADNDVITGVHYGLLATDGTNTVETEGEHTFKNVLSRCSRCNQSSYQLCRT